MPESTLPPLKATATLDVAPFRQGISEIQRDLRAVRDLARQVGTIRLTADLSAGRDVQRAVRSIRDAVQEAVPTEMQRRIATLFGGFDVGVNSAAQSAAVFEARAAALRARIDELDRAVRITRANFQAGFGEATPEEISQLTAAMARLQNELNEVGDTARREFGEYSREAQKVANANRLAETTAAAARGEITRLGLASQVKLGVGAALQAYGPQALGAANGLFQFARASDTARIAQGLFQKSVEKTGNSSEAAAQVVARLADALGVSTDMARESIRGLLRQGYTLQQAFTALQGAGASALAAGRSAADGMQGYVDAVTSGTSAMLNQIGIAENLSTFYQRQARELGKTVDAMTRQEKVQAELALITAATSDEVADLTALQSGLGGAVNSTTRELAEAQKQLGEAVVPVAINAARALTRVLDVFNALPQPVQTTVTILAASAVAIGVLYAPVSALAVGLRGAWESLMRFGPAARAVDAAAVALGRLNLAARISEAGGFLPWLKSAPAALKTFTASTLAASGAQNVLSAAFLRTAGATTVLSGALGTLTLASAAALAGVGALAAGLGVLWAKQVQGTTAVYEQIDQANQQAFERTMARVRALMKEGSELSKAKARVLLLQQQLADAEQGTLVSVNPLTGERTYQRDEQAIKRLREQLVGARQEVVQLYTEAQRRGATNVVLTEEQTQAVKDLRQALEGRAFELRLRGMTDLQADLARLDKEFDDLREKFKKLFYVDGKLLDPAQTPALRQGLSDLDAQKAAEQANVRKKYAADAAKTARDAAVEAQRAEIEAMREGAAKRTAQRQLELDEIRRAAAEKVKALADFPQRQREVEAAAQREIAAKRRLWAQEDAQAARENQKRVQDAVRAARDATIAAMRDGYAKEEAQRKAALDDLRTDLAERVRLEQDPGVKAQLQAAGQQQMLALIAQQARERADAVRQAEEQIRDVQRASRDTTLAAMQEGYAKEVALRQAALSDLRASLTRQLAQFRGTEAQRAQFVQEANRQILALYQRQQVELRNILADGARTVMDAEARARSAEVALIQDETVRKRAARQEELRALEEQTRQTLAAFQGTEAQRQRLIDAARREEQAKRQQWAREDEALARETARRLAQVWLEAGNKQAAAQQAAREAALAGYNLDVSRRLARAADDPIARARTEQEAVARRAEFAQQAAEQQFAQEQANLARRRDLELSAENLSAEARRAIWASYYADLAKLDADFQAGNRQRLQQREEQERQAAETLRQARVQAANRPVEAAQRNVARLQASRDLATSDAELLQIDRQITAERERQIAALQAQLNGVNGVRLTAEERAQVEDRIAGLQHDQAVSLRDQATLARELRQSVFDRLEAETQLAERLGRTEQERAQARQRLLAIQQARLRDLDDQIAQEGRERERNALLTQRFNLLGQIADLQDRIQTAPLEAGQRQLELFRAQAEAELALAGRSEDRVAQANLAARVAARELLLANARVAVARTDLEQHTALVGQAQARVAFAQALLAQQQASREAEDLALARARSAREADRAAEDLTVARRQAEREVVKRQLDLDNSLLDAAEARARAMLQIKRLAGDAVLSAEQELQTTRERLALSARQLASAEDPETRSGLLRQRIQLLAQAAEQERTLAEARRAEQEVTRELGNAGSRLMAELQGGAPLLERFEEALRRVGAARARLAEAEKAYADARRQQALAPNQQNAEALDAAANRLTAAIRDQRKELRALAGEYRDVISQMDGVREAGNRLQQVVYGEGDPLALARERQTKRSAGLLFADDKTFYNVSSIYQRQVERELQRFDAITQRRDAAQRALAAALQGGEANTIAKAANELAQQEERYRKQADMLEKNGIRIRRTGEQETERLADQVDQLGIQYDREAVLLEQRAQVVDQEAQAAITFSEGATRFADSTQEFVSALSGAYIDLQNALSALKAERDLEAARRRRREEEDAAEAAAARRRDEQRREEDASAAARLGGLDQVAAKLAAGVAPLAQALGGLGQLSQQLARGVKLTVPPELLRGLQPSERSLTPTPTTQPVTNYNITHNYGPINITAMPRESAEALANRVISRLEDRARRSGRRC